MSKKRKEQIPSCADVFELVDCLTMVLSLLPEGYMLPSMLVCKAFLVAVRNTNRKKEKTSMKYVWNSSRTLQWAIKELRYVMTIKGLARAAENAQLGAMRWALANGCPVDVHTCSYAAKGGHMEILQWARTRGCPWDERVCKEAAKGGYMEILQWARNNGCPWDERVSKEAAKGGHLQLLQWARTHGCPWDQRVCQEAAKGGHLPLLQWAHSHGCPWDVSTSVAALIGGQPEMLRWAFFRVVAYDPYIMQWLYEGGYLAELLSYIETEPV